MDYNNKTFVILIFRLGDNKIYKEEAIAKENKNINGKLYGLSFPKAKTFLFVPLEEINKPILKHQVEIQIFIEKEFEEKYTTLFLERLEEERKELQAMANRIPNGVY